jgi:hypothetical protein
MTTMRLNSISARPIRLMFSAACRLVLCNEIYRAGLATRRTSWADLDSASLPAQPTKPKALGGAQPSLKALR